MPNVDVPDRDNGPGSGPIGALRKSVVESLGPRAVHAVEDGLTVGVCVGLSVTSPGYAAVLLVSLGVIPKRAGALAMLKELPDLVRESDARAQEAYFTISALIGVMMGFGVGSILPPFAGVV
jgi:hypothetical protein